MPKTFKISADVGRKTVVIICDGDQTVVPPGRWVDVADALGIPIKADIEEQGKSLLGRFFMRFGTTEKVLHSLVQVRGVEYPVSKLSHLGHFGGMSSAPIRDIHNG